MSAGSTAIAISARALCVGSVKSIVAPRRGSGGSAIGTAATVVVAIGSSVVVAVVVVGGSVVSVVVAAPVVAGGTIVVVTFAGASGSTSPEVHELAKSPTSTTVAARPRADRLRLCLA